MDKIETGCFWIILKKKDGDGPTFFNIMANRLDKDRFHYESFCLWCNDNFVSKGIP